MPIRATTPLDPSKPSDLPPEERVELAFKRWKKAKGAHRVHQLLQEDVPQPQLLIFHRH